MMLRKKITNKEVLEIVSQVALKDLPPDMDGTVEARFDKDGGVEVIFFKKDNLNKDNN